MFIPDEDKIIRSSIKGKFKGDFNLKKDKTYKVNFVVVGDWVSMELLQDGSGVIYGIEERENYLSRKSPKIKGSGYRGERLEQVIAANIDNLFIVTSVNMPKFNNRVLDRILVAGESANLKIYIIINKVDLVQDDEYLAWADLYAEIGYKVFFTSAVTEQGLNELKNEFTGKKNLFWGASGVGKSSILNALFPQLNYRTNEISNFTLKGKHTTVTSVMEKLDKDTFIIDTPGVREIDPYGITRENLSHYFIEFQPYIEQCRFNTCIHNHEPGCGVIKAVQNEEISVERYESYLRMLETIEEGMVM